MVNGAEPSIARRGVRPEWWCVAAGLAYGALLTVAWPPVNVWWLAFVVPLPLLLVGEYVARKPITARRAGILVALGSLPFWFLQTRWLIDVTIAGYPCLAVYESLYTGAFVGLLTRVRRGRDALPLWLVAPLIWVGLEVVRGEIMLTGYPWFLAGHPLVEMPILASPAAVVGAYGVSVLLVMLVASVTALACRRWSGDAGGDGSAVSFEEKAPQARTRPIIGSPVVGLVIAVVLWMALGVMARSLPDNTARTVRIAVIQTNLPQSNKMGWPLRQRIEDFVNWVKMTVMAAAPDPTDHRTPDVIVWPETMFPGDALNAEAVEVLTASNLTWPASMLGEEGDPSARPLRCDEFAVALKRVQVDLGIPLVVGSLTLDGLRVVRNEGKITIESEAKFNSAVLIAEGQIDPNRYDKHSLTPFGEAIPYAWRVPALQRAVLALGAGGMKFDLGWGQRSGPLNAPIKGPGAGDSTAHVRLATPICFEVVRSTLCRQLVHEGDPGTPVLLVNISNDGWFTQWPEGRAQHFQIARWRCIELGVPMVRSVNTGISGAIDARGRVLARGIPGPTGTIESHTSGVLTLDVPVARASETPFSKWIGNVPGYGCLVAAVGLILSSWRRGRLDRPASDLPPARTTTP